MFDDITFRIMELSHKGYCCSQVLMILALESRGKKKPDLVRAMAGLCFGGQDRAGICGVLTGAACLLSMYTAKGSDNETANYRFDLIQSELAEWFREAIGAGCGGIRCSDIMGEGTGYRTDSGICQTILAETYAKVIELLEANGICLESSDSDW